MRQQQTTRQVPSNSCRTRRRKIAETVVLLLLCSASISGFTVGGRKLVPLTRKHSTAKSFDRHIEPSVDEQPSRKFPWAKKPQHASEDDTERREDQAVDEYLEFLDRRYRRLHDDDLKTSEQLKPSFSAWNWLHQQPEPRTETVAPEQSQADALYVLGVAGLASKKLLQKHHIQFGKIDHRATRKAEEATTPTDVIDVVSDESMSTSSRWSQKKQLLMNRLAQALARLSNKRRSLLQFQKRQLASLARSTIVTVAQAPREIAVKAWNLGGGKRNVMFTASLLVAFTFVILQPVLKTAAREGLNMTIG